MIYLFSLDIRICDLLQGDPSEKRVKLREMDRVAVDTDFASRAESSVVDKIFGTKDILRERMTPRTGGRSMRRSRGVQQV